MLSYIVRRILIAIPVLIGITFITFAFPCTRRNSGLLQQGCKFARDGVHSLETMGKALDPKERLLLIRKGNEIFNKGEIEKAARIFMTTRYRDGLIRVGDCYYFDKRDILRALHYYIEAKHEKMIREITERMATVLKKWLGESRPGPAMHAAKKEE